MPPRKTKDKNKDIFVAPDGTPHSFPQRAAIVPKTPMQWGALLQTAKKQHWRTIRVTIQLRDKLLAGKPKQLDAAKAMLKARGLEDQIEVIPMDDLEARKAEAETVVDEGLCEFHRREGKSGLWFPTNHVKAMLKENWSVMGFRIEHRGSRGALAEGMFVHAVIGPDDPEVEHDWLYLQDEPDEVLVAVAHTMSIRGPVSSVKRHEVVYRPTLTFDIMIAHAVEEKLPDNAWAETFVHAAEHGLGACRSQGYGRFDVVSVVDVVDGKPMETPAEAPEQAPGLQVA
jgi:hypothetical protein